MMATREREADEFYTRRWPAASIDPNGCGCSDRPAPAGLEQADLPVRGSIGGWTATRPTPPPPGHRTGRNAGWRHLDSFDVLAMPDPWEYPWFAAWDLAFHTIPWAHLDPAFAKYQLLVLLRSGPAPERRLPAYEWNFDDVNPPVHALAALRVFVIDGSTPTTTSWSGCSRSCC